MQNKERRTKMNLIVIEKNGMKSVHTSFKKACVAYGWKYDKWIKNGVPKEVWGHKVTKLTENEPIYVQRIRKALELGLIVQSNEYIGDYSEERWDLRTELQFDNLYLTVECICGTTWTTDNGEDEMREAHRFLIRIEKILDEEGDELLHIPAELEKQIENLINVEP